MLEKSTSELEQFRHTLYQNFNNRADSLMEVIDALCSSPAAESPVELTLAACYRRSYSTLYKAIDGFAWQRRQLAEWLFPYLPRPRQRRFWLLGVDVTSQPRAYAPTLYDRGMVYQPNAVKGNQPVTVGHQHSTVALLPEAESGMTASWLVPLATQRVATDEDKELAGAAQIDALLDDDALPFADELCVAVGDSGYSKPESLHSHRQHKNLVSLARVRSNRTFYRQAVAEGEGTRRGHPTWYGDAFSLKDATPWHPADETVTLSQVSRYGKRYQVEIHAWHNLLMRGQYPPQRLPMHEHPFTLARIVRFDERGVQLGQHPLWLLVSGARRSELSLSDIYRAYEQRFDLEHCFRFGKQKLLLTAFQTPATEREEKWWQMVHLAYAQRWMARHVAHCLPRPWERSLPAMRTRRISPTLVQRDLARIIRQWGTPAQPPKRRGYSPGRRNGHEIDAASPSQRRREAPQTGRFTLSSARLFGC